MTTPPARLGILALLAAACAFVAAWRLARPARVVGPALRGSPGALARGAGLSESQPAAPMIPVTRGMRGVQPALAPPRGGAVAAPGDIRDPADSGRIVAEHVADLPGEPGVFRRTRLALADFKYPLLRIEEKVRRGGPSGGERILTRSVMVGDHVVVKLAAGADETALRRACAEAGAAIRRKMRTAGMYLVSFAPAGVDGVPRTIALLARHERVVRYAHPDHLVHAHATYPNDPDFGLLWGLNMLSDRDIDAPEAWDLTVGRRGVVVAVIDTGVDYDHADLAANAWVNPGEIAGNGLDDDGNGYVDDVHGWDFYNDDSDPRDDHSHGTHCAGTIGAVGNNGVGIAGVNWRVSIMAIKFLAANGYGTDSDAIDSVNYATTMRQRGVPVRLTSNSWGGGDFVQGLLDAILDSGEAGMLFVASAGNDNTNTDLYPDYPSCFNASNIISVAATTASDTRASFSNYGVVNVDLGAPGVSIYSTVPGGYGYKQGTSMAAPHVAGVVALAWTARWNVSAMQVRQAILKGVDVVPGLAGKVATGGRLNAYGALRALPADGVFFGIK